LTEAAGLGPDQAGFSRGGTFQPRVTLPPPDRVEKLYDLLAPKYDDEVGGTSGAALAKARSTTKLKELFKPGELVLDIGCGTGNDACFLGGRGVRVVALDISSRMLELTAALARERGVADKVTPVHLPAARAGELAATYGPSSFDGAYSLFGTLNLEPSLAPVRDALAAILKPNSKILVGLVNPLVLWELTLYPMLLRFGKPAKKAGRLTSMQISKDRPERVAVYLYSPAEFARAFEPAFELEAVEGTNIFVPPPHLDKFIRPLPKLAGLLARAERRVSKRPPWNQLGYFALLTLRRKPD
jgi:SAM-dependent methyltransferase